MGNNTSEYDTSILPSNSRTNPFDGDETKATAKDQEVEDNLSSPDEKATAKGKKSTVKKEVVTPAKRTRAQVDHIADTEIARLECKKAKFETEKEHFGMLASVASAKAQAKSNRLIRLAELNFEHEKMQRDHEYRLEMLKHSQVPPLSSPVDSQGHPSTTLNGLQPYPAAWHSTTSTTPLSDSQPLSVSQPFSESNPQPSSQSYAPPQPTVEFKVPSLEGFPLQSLENSDGEHRNSPRSGSDLFDGTIY